MSTLPRVSAKSHHESVESTIANFLSLFAEMFVLSRNALAVSHGSAHRASKVDLLLFSYEFVFIVIRLRLFLKILSTLQDAM